MLFFKISWQPHFQFKWIKKRTKQYQWRKAFQCRLRKNDKRYDRRELQHRKLGFSDVHDKICYPTVWITLRLIKRLGLCVFLESGSMITADTMWLLSRKVTKDNMLSPLLILTWNLSALSKYRSPWPSLWLNSQLIVNSLLFQVEQPQLMLHGV